MFNEYDESRVYEKFWRPYPVLEPSIVLPQVQIAPGLYYSSAFESGILLYKKCFNLSLS